MIRLTVSIRGMQEEVLINFLRGTGPDSHGRYHSDILKFTDEELEVTHDYIQWLFPLREPSEAVPGSPYIQDDATVAHLRSDERAQQHFLLALARMRGFYAVNDFWLRQGDHNHLRITRILKSVMLWGDPAKARYFYEFILWRVQSVQPVTPESLEYWKQSIS